MIHRLNSGSQAGGNHATALYGEAFMAVGELSMAAAQGIERNNAFRCRRPEYTIERNEQEYNITVPSRQQARSCVVGKDQGLGWTVCVTLEQRICGVIIACGQGRAEWVYLCLFATVAVNFVGAAPRGEGGGGPTGYGRRLLVNKPRCEIADGRQFGPQLHFLHLVTTALHKRLIDRCLVMQNLDWAERKGVLV